MYITALLELYEQKKPEPIYIEMSNEQNNISITYPI